MSQLEQELAAGEEEARLAGSVAKAGEAFGEQLVPVSEAIRYRKRAQAAEQQVQELRARSGQQEREQQEMAARLTAARREAELTREMMKAGAVDVEAGVLLAGRRLEARSEGDDERSIGEVISELRRERPWLFREAGSDGGGGAAGPTAGVRGRQAGGQATLGRLGGLAQRAQESGTRRDMQEYLRLRRAVRG